MRDLENCYVQILPSCGKMNNAESGFSRNVEKSGRNECRCNIACREGTIPALIRMMALAMAVLFGLCILLFFWNIVLWRDLANLQGQVTALTDELKEVQSSQNDVIQSEDDVNDASQSLDSHDINPLLSRQKRGTGTADDLDYQNIGAGESVLSRVKRGKSKRRGKCPDRGGSRRSRRGCPKLQKVNPATAIHVRIRGTQPYQGMQSDDPILHTWETNPSVNQGFDISKMNLGNGQAGVIVKNSGIYFVYSQVVFRMNRTLEVHEKIMIGYTGNSELSTCSNSLPAKHNKDDYITCYSSGIAYLGRGYKFRIKIYPAHLEVFASPTHTYFGAFLLGARA